MKFLFILIILTSTAFGQRDSTGYAKQSFDIIYGQKLLSYNNFNGAINTFNSWSLGTPLTFIGIGTTADLIVSRNIHHDGHFAYTQILPQSLKVNDSINAKITGFNFAFTLCGLDLARNKSNFDAIFALGGNTGRLRLFGNSLTKQKNPYFSPKASFIIRYIIGKICLQVNCDHEFDISKKNWRKTHSSDTSPKINLPQTSNSGLTIRVCLGYILPEKKPTDYYDDAMEE